MEETETRIHKIIKRNFLMTKWENTMATPGCHDFIMVLDHLKPDFNVGKIFRSSDFFGCKQVHLVGIPFFNPSPSMGGFRHVPAKFCSSLEESFQGLRDQQYEIFALDVDTEESLFDIQMPKKTAFVIGHEQNGLSFTKEQFPYVRRVKIPNFGKAQSLNAAIAASLAMYEWLKQNRNYKGLT